MRLALLPCLLLATIASAQAPDMLTKQVRGNGPPPHHEFAVVIDDAKSTVAGTDRLTLPWR